MAIDGADAFSVSNPLHDGKVRGAAPSPAAAIGATKPASAAGDGAGKADAAPTLPPGWVEKTSRSTGRAYFWSSATGETTFVRPMGHAVTAGTAETTTTAAVTAAAKTVSSAAVATAGGNDKTTRAVKADALGGSGEAKPVTSAHAATLPPLRAGWLEKKSRSTGAAYYVESASGATTFERPF
jgi:hypothetical protein